MFRNEDLSLKATCDALLTEILTENNNDWLDEIKQQTISNI